MNDDQANRVLAILESTERNLKALAALAGQDAFSFYRGADMTSLDLSGQDLRGMNFDKADFRFSDLSRVEFDQGAFNGSILDNQQAWLADEFEFYATDIFKHPIDEILIFCRFRPDVIEPVISESGIGYRNFAEDAGVSANALRKARKGSVVAYETAYKIIKLIDNHASRILGITHDPQSVKLLRQPFIEFLSGGTNLPFKHVSRDRLQELYRMRAEIVEIRRITYPQNGTPEWRDTPEFIDNMLVWYRDHRARFEAQEALRASLEEMAAKT